MSTIKFDEIATEAKLRALGPNFDPTILSATRDLYRTGTASLPWSNRALIADLSYGPAPRHRLDVYPADAPNAPVLVFLHGGGFVGGDKSGDPQFYSNVGRYFAEHGYCTVAANYRLAPDSDWPSGNHDVADIMHWVASEISRYGGDATRIVLVGQSAGAAHIAGYLFDQRWGGQANKAIRAVALLSGFYRAKHPMYPGPATYLGTDETQWPDRSPATHVQAEHPPLLLSVAELDPAQIAEQTLDLARVLNDVDGCPPELHWFAGHNHVSTVHGLGLGRDSVGSTLRSFAEKHLKNA